MAGTAERHGAALLCGRLQRFLLGLPFGGLQRVQVCMLGAEGGRTLHVVCHARAVLLCMHRAADGCRAARRASQTGSMCVCPAEVDGEQKLLHAMFPPFEPIHGS